MSNAKSLTPRQEDRRHRILSATRKMVADHGYDGMVMSQVAELAEVSPTTLYNLYNTKDELLLESLRELLVDSYQKVGERSDEPGWKYLLSVVGFGASLRASEPAYGEAITDAMLRALPGDPLCELLLRTVQQDFLYNLRKMDEQGELKEGVEVEHLSTILLGNYWSTFLLINKGMEEVARMQLSLEINLMSVLFAATHGAARDQIELALEGIRKEARTYA